jgi:hypothetical protein
MLDIDGAMLIMVTRGGTQIGGDEGLGTSI